MKKIILLGLILLFNAIQLIAQSDFRNGYIINNQNDTIIGLIDYKGNKASAHKCTFRKSIKADNQIFTPKQIKGYRFIDSKYYISKAVDLDNETKQIFLEYLIDGVVDIFYYRDNGEHYLVSDDSDKLHELVSEEKEILTNGKKYSKVSKKYLGVLKAAFKESPSINKRVDNISLTHKSLIKITRDYHTEVCSTEGCIIYEKKLPKIKNTFGVIIGMNSLSITESDKFDEVYHYYMKNLDFGIINYISVGIFYKVNLRFLNERTFIQYEGTYSKLNLSASNSYTKIVGSMTYLDDITMSFNSFSNMAMIKYEFPKGKIRPTYQFGFFYDRFLKPESNRNTDVLHSWGDINYSNNYTTKSFIGPFKNFDFGVSLGVGVKSFYMKDKELFLDLKYKRGFGLADQLNTNTFLLNLGIQI